MKCAHPECDCLEQTVAVNGELFCNAACAASAAESENHCGCGHGSCGGAKEPEETVTTRAGELPASP